jgi:hypothetical protein
MGSGRTSGCHDFGMAISVVVMTNYGDRELGRYQGELVNRIIDIGRTDRSRFPMLYGVDPYSNTAFNCLQMEMMAEELQAIRSESSDSDVVGATTQMLTLTELVCAAPHRSMRFLGD